MGLSFCVLGSGSGGNSTLVVCHQGEKYRCVLIDCGLSPRATVQRLAELGCAMDAISGILLTHFDSDHFYSGWLKVIQRKNLSVFVHRRHRAAAWRAGLTAEHVHLFDDTVVLEHDLIALPVMLAHDDLGSVGYVIQHEELRLGYATDLGCVPKELFDHFVDLDALAIESNYDREMQLTSDRPAYLKRRIMGGRGHLSNAQSLEAVYRIAETSALSHIAALHLSRQCNHPDHIRALYEREAPHLLERLTITNQHRPTDLLRITRCAAAQRRQHVPVSPRSVITGVAKNPRQLALFAD